MSNKVKLVIVFVVIAIVAGGAAVGLALMWGNVLSSEDLTMVLSFGTGLLCGAAGMLGGQEWYYNWKNPG